jgi:ATP-dependent DNA ligase
LYSDTLDFQKVVGLVRRESISPQDLDDMQEVSYRIYDMFSKDESITSMPFAGRYKRVTDRINAIGSPLAIVESYTVENADDVREYHDKFVNQGYEGVMVRNPRKPYEMDKRSSGLMKFKDFKDDEYKIVGYTEATGNDAGTVIWTCVAPNGLTFNVRPKGTREERTEAFNNADSYIGKMLTVRYFELTNDGVPRFPVGIAIRDYE